MGSILSSEILPSKHSSSRAVTVGAALSVVAIAFYAQHACCRPLHQTGTKPEVQLGPAAGKVTKQQHKRDNQRFAEIVRFLFEVPLMKCISPDQYPTLAATCVIEEFQPGEVIQKQSHAHADLFIVKGGSVHVSWTEEGSEGKSLVFLTQGDCFNANNLPGAYIEAAEFPVVLARISEIALHRCGLSEVVASHTKQLLVKTHADLSRFLGSADESTNFAMDLAAPKMQIARRELVKIGLLGCGGFGCVDLMEHRKSKALFAMKAVSKGYIVKAGMQESAMNEKLILQITNSPFIVRLYETYNGAQMLYYLMEAGRGGELYSTYNRKGFHGNVQLARYYAASIACALHHLHDRYIVWRGVKPEDCVLDSEGRMKIVDMGLAKLVYDKTFTTCGTPDYFAPELISSSGHCWACDWWALGILIFELLSGKPPFESAFPMQIYSKVMKGIGKVEFPPACKGPAEDLIKALLSKDPDERLPMKPGGVDNLKKHKWFDGFDWKGLLDQTLAPPYAPVVKGHLDLSNFTASESDKPKLVEYTDDGSGWDAGF